MDIISSSPTKSPLNAPFSKNGHPFVIPSSVRLKMPSHSRKREPKCPLPLAKRASNVSGGCDKKAPPLAKNFFPLEVCLITNRISGPTSGGRRVPGWIGLFRPGVCMFVRRQRGSLFLENIFLIGFGFVGGLAKSWKGVYELKIWRFRPWFFWIRSRFLTFQTFSSNLSYLYALQTTPLSLSLPFNQNVFFYATSKQIYNFFLKTAPNHPFFRTQKAPGTLQIFTKSQLLFVDKSPNPANLSLFIQEESVESC